MECVEFSVGGMIIVVDIVTPPKCRDEDGLKLIVLCSEQAVDALDHLAHVEHGRE